MIRSITHVCQAAAEVAEGLVNFALPPGHPVRQGFSCPKSDLDWVPDGELRGAWVSLEFWVPGAEIEAHLEWKGAERAKGKPKPDDVSWTPMQGHIEQALKEIGEVIRRHFNC